MLQTLREERLACFTYLVFLDIHLVGFHDGLELFADLVLGFQDEPVGVMNNQQEEQISTLQSYARPKETNSSFTGLTHPFLACLPNGLKVFC